MMHLDWRKEDDNCYRATRDGGPTVVVARWPESSTIWDYFPDTPPWRWFFDDFPPEWSDEDGEDYDEDYRGTAGTLEEAVRCAEAAYPTVEEQRRLERQAEKNLRIAGTPVYPGVEFSGFDD
jgi:hypothetical protein